MEKNKLSTLTLEELYKKKKTTTAVLVGFGIVMIITCSLLVFLIFKNKNFVLLPVVIGCLMSLLPMLIVLSQINTEIKSRQSK